VPDLGSIRWCGGKGRYFPSVTVSRRSPPQRHIFFQDSVPMLCTLLFILSLVPAILAQPAQEGLVPIDGTIPGVSSPALGVTSTLNAPVSSTVSSPAPLVTIRVTMNGVDTTLTQLEGEDFFATSRRWVTEHNLGGDAEVDNILRLLVNQLRREAGATDGLPRTTESGNILAEVKVQGKLGEGEELGPMHMARWLDPETVEEAAAGFVERLGLPFTPNAQNLLDEFVRVANSKNIRGGSGGPPPAPPSVPAHLGVSVPVTFQEGGAATTLEYHYGEKVSTTVDAFLDQHRVLEVGVRNEAKAALTEAVIGRVNAIMREGTPAKGVAPAPPAHHQDTVFAAHAFVLPVAVGEVGYDINVHQGASIWKTSKAFCEKHWEVVGPKMMGVAEKLVAKGGVEAAGIERHVSVDTCRAVVFDLLTSFAS